MIRIDDDDHDPDALDASAAHLAGDPEAAPPGGGGQEASALRAVAHTFFVGALAAVLTAVPLLAVPTHCCCGATRSGEAARAQRARCIELGVTPEELAQLDAAAAATDERP